jgi:DNA replication protein DnaC
MASFAELTTQMISNLRLVSEEETQEAERKEREEKKQKTFERSGVGRRYWNLTMDDFKETPENAENRRAIADYIASGSMDNLWMVGATGTGKTMLGAMIVRELGGVYVKSYQLINDVLMSASYSAKESVNEIVNRYAGYKRLVIDEVGKSGNKDTEINILWQILNERYENEVPTVMISNLSKADLANYLGSHIVDRFAGCTKALEFSGGSWRQNGR